MMRIRVILGVCLVVCGACSSSSDTPTSPSPPNPPTSPGQTISYTAIGASDGIGFGGSAPCVPLTVCPNGTGYAQTSIDASGDGGAR